MAKGIAKVRVLRGFSLPGQGYYRVGGEIALRFERDQTVGVLSPAQYKKLLERGYIEPIEEEVTNGEVQS